MSASANNVKITPIDATWEIEEQVCLEFADLVAASLNNTYFNIYDENTTYYVWYDLDGTGVDPAPGGTGISVAVATGDLPSAILSATQTAIESATGYTGRVDGTRLFITLDTTEKVVGNAADVDSGVGVDIVNKGASTYLGLLDGNVEPAFEQQLLDLTAHQFGTSVLAQLVQGNNATVSLVLKESTQALYKEIFEAGGDTFTPVAGTELYGWGDSKQGGNTLVYSRRLVFHPRALPVSDKSQDLTFWLAYPNPDSIVYSGEEFQLLNVTFTTFLDLSKPRAIRRFAFGDSSQSGITV